MRDPKRELRDLISRMYDPIDIKSRAEEDATRIMLELGLRHPMTLSAVLKVVSTELAHARLPEIEETARVLYTMLNRRHDEPGTTQ